MNLLDLTEEEKMLIAEFRLCNEADKEKILRRFKNQSVQSHANGEPEKCDS